MQCVISFCSGDTLHLKIDSFSLHDLSAHICNMVQMVLCGVELPFAPRHL